MSYDTEAANDALALLKEFGALIPVVRVSNKINPVLGSTLPTKTDGTLTAVILPAKATANNLASGQADDFSEALRVGKARFVLAAAVGNTFTPAINDTLTFEGAVWRVHSASTLAPAGTAIIHKLGVVKV